MALYHSAKGPVNYTVVGNPTIVDGVASGFSNSNYLTIPAPNLSTANDWEMATKANIPRLSDTFQVLLTGSRDHQFAGLDIDGNGFLGAAIGNSSGDGWQIIENSTNWVGTRKRVPLNTDFWAKLTFNGSKYSVYYSEDGENWEETVYFNSTQKVYYDQTNILSIGIGRSLQGLVFSGSIDLNNTYIKINGQPWFGVRPVEVKKHQLRGPVGYTVVGSPTIKDGVASGFSSSDYLIAMQAYPTEITSYEKNIRFKWANLAGTYQVLFGGTSYDRVFFSGYTNCIVSMRTSSGNMYNMQVGELPMTVGNWYVLNTKFADSIVTVKLLSDEGTVLFTKTFNFDYINSPNTTPRIGQSSPDGGGFFAGSIDINETYIKVNGKLWFYQPANTKYIVKDGKLVFAAQDLYLTGPNNYTVVGSPTVIDGVASGFSANNYLEVNNQVSPSPFETYVSFKTGNSLTGIQTLYENVLDLNNSLELFINAGKLAASVKVNGSFIAVTATGSLQLNANTEYIAILKYTGSSYIYSAISAGTETVIWTLASNDNVFGGNNRIGNNTLANRAFDGSIDLNETYIKVNNQLWFYGKNYATQNIAPVPAGYTYGTTTTPSIGYVDMRTQAFTAAPQGATIGRDE